ncbi:MAG: flavodoxin [Lachnospiraceae bacterium]|nr:flavodoxin [Lachnospiraceae bacterium]
MGKVNIIFWSGTGNTAAMAEYIRQGVEEAGGEAQVISVGTASVADAESVKALALGCPSMGAEQLEEVEMEPYMCDIEGVISGKQVVLFGSYGWGNQEWMRDWEARIQSAGATVVNGEGIAVNGAPTPDIEEACKDAGRTLASLS